jgi:hypothetical protein
MSQALFGSGIQMFRFSNGRFYNYEMTKTDKIVGFLNGHSKTGRFWLLWLKQGGG